MTTDPNRHHTRAATLAGVYPAPKLPRDTPSQTSSPSSATRSLAGATGSPKTRPVTPELLYSTVASAVSLSRGVSPVQGVDPSSSPSALSELPPSLSRDVDFGRTESPKNTVMHGESMSVNSDILDPHATPLLVLSAPSVQSDSVSTISKATQDMSREDLVSLARRYESMAHDVMAEANRKLSASLVAGAEFDNSGSADIQDPMHGFLPLSPVTQQVKGHPATRGKVPILVTGVPQVSLLIYLSMISSCSAKHWITLLRLTAWLNRRNILPFQVWKHRSRRERY
ncbi:hypothetical protein B0H12DRAFT_1079518 [Mycena haematopus]|nr:hypothetical protein B0H12DRAFT_1079518 [Mycena haematopus]